MQSERYKKSLVCSKAWQLRSLREKFVSDAGKGAGAGADESSEQARSMVPARIHSYSII
jgi:hypothetical protein